MRTKESERDKEERVSEREREETDGQVVYNLDRQIDRQRERESQRERTRGEKMESMNDLRGRIKGDKKRK